jgi:cell division septum initiation protein DivIVA
MAKTAQDLANDTYKELAATHSDLLTRRKGLDAQIAEIEKQIEGINAHVPLLHKLEAMVRAEIEAANKPAQKLENITNLVDDPNERG